MKAKQTQRKNTGKITKKAAPKQTRARTARGIASHVVTKPKTVRAKVKKHAKKILVPHKENEFRPHLIRVHGLVAVLVIALLAQIVYGFITTGHLSVLGRVSDISSVDLLKDTNIEREKQGLTPLRMNDALSSAALLKAQDMFKYDYWAHTSPTGVEPWKWLGDTGYNYSYAGENLAKNYPTAVATVDAWMNSASHRANILNKQYVDVGFAVVDGTLDGQNTTLVVAMYGAPVAATITSAEAPVDAQGVRFAAPATVSGNTNPLSYFGVAALSLSPVTIAVLGMLAVVAIVGAVAHHYRRKLPKAWRQNWKKNHGMYTFFGMIILGALIIFATGGGSI